MKSCWPDLIKITAEGKVKITVYGESKIVSLNKTLHVPDLSTNLMSVNKITDTGFSVIFTKENAKVFDADINVKIIADKVGDLYFARESGRENSKPSYALSSTEKSSEMAPQTRPSKHKRHHQGTVDPSTA